MTARITHLMGWTVIRVGGSSDLVVLTEPAASEARVVLDLATDPGAEHDGTLVRWQADATGTSTRLLVASASEVRDRLRAAGLLEVHESLDAAVGDEAPAQHVEPQISHNLPFAGDTVVVTAQDMLGRDGR